MNACQSGMWQAFWDLNPRLWWDQYAAYCAAMYQNPASAPKPGGSMTAGTTSVGGPCTLVIGGTYFYICLNNHVYSLFVLPISIPGRPCSGQAVASALDGILGGLGGAWVIPPGIVSLENYNPQLNTLLQQGQHA